jgi:hypothetical protein
MHKRHHRSGGKPLPLDLYFVSVAFRSPFIIVKDMAVALAAARTMDHVLLAIEPFVDFAVRIRAWWWCGQCGAAHRNRKNQQPFHPLTRLLPPAALRGASWFAARSIRAQSPSRFILPRPAVSNLPPSESFAANIVATSTMAAATPVCTNKIGRKSNQSHPLWRPTNSTLAAGAASGETSGT